MIYLIILQKYGKGINMILKIFDLLRIILLFAACIYIAIYHFRKTYPTRFGKKHVELRGVVVGEDIVVTRGGASKCPILEFYYDNKRYQISDTTYILVFRKFKIGDTFTVCFNPDVNDKVIIKRSIFNFATLIWFYFMILAVICFIILIISLNNYL